MRLIAALLLSLMLVSSVSLAEPPPPTGVESRSRVFKDWWLWTLVAVVSAGTVVTTVVVATVPSHASPDTMGLTVRF